MSCVGDICQIGSGESATVEQRGSVRVVIDGVRVVVVGGLVSFQVVIDVI